MCEAPKDGPPALYYNRARYYDPTTGRFLSEDPIGFKGGVNFYAYVHNSPLNFNDPSGMCPPQNPCANMGGAMSPSQYAAAGQAFKSSYIDPVSTDSDSALVLAGLATLYSDFHKGGSLDAQPYATGNNLQKAGYGNYAFGVFFAAAGVPLNQALTAASIYGYKQQIVNGAYKGSTFGPQYRGIPIENIQNIVSGYNDQLNGTTCQ